MLAEKLATLLDVLVSAIPPAAVTLSNPLVKMRLLEDCEIAPSPERLMPPTPAWRNAPPLASFMWIASPPLPAVPRIDTTPPAATLSVALISVALINTPWLPVPLPLLTPLMASVPLPLMYTCRGLLEKSAALTPMLLLIPPALPTMEMLPLLATSTMVAVVERVWLYRLTPILRSLLVPPTPVMAMSPLYAVMLTFWSIRTPAAPLMRLGPAVPWMLMRLPVPPALASTLVVYPSLAYSLTPSFAIPEVLPPSPVMLMLPPWVCSVVLAPTL